MSNLTNLIISLLSPTAIVCGLIIFDSFFDTQSVAILFVLILCEHGLFAYLLGVEIDREPGLMIFSFPSNELILKATVVLDYLLVALAVYALLTVFTRRITPVQKLP